MLTYRVLSQSDYADQLVSLISRAEGPEPDARDTNDGEITIGYGYVFGRNDNVALWTAAGITLSPQQLAVLARVDAAPTKAQKNQIALASFDRTLNTTESAALLRQTYLKYEGPANTLGMPNSIERAAFISITYNRGVGSTKNAMGELAAALNGNDRAEAWFQLRYKFWGSNTNFEPGIRGRRLVESQLFSLQEQPGTTPSAAEANQIFQMLERHRDEIISLEKRWGVSPDGLQGQPTRNLIDETRRDSRWGNLPRVDTIVEALNPAKTALLADLRDTNPNLADKLQDSQWISTNIYLSGSFGGTVDTLTYETGDFKTNGAADLMIGGVSADTLKGNKGRDLLIGNAGTDTLDGGEDNDILIGGTGDDKLMGGTGVDTYVFNAGDGKDTIQDTDGLGKIQIGANTLTGGGQGDYVLDGVWNVNNGETVYTLDEAQKKLVISGSKLGDGNSITIKLDNAAIAKLEGTDGSTDGYLGLKLNRQYMTALIKGTGTNVFAQPGFNPGSLAGLQAKITEGGGCFFTLCLNTPAHANDTYTLALSGAPDKFLAVRGDSTVPADGAVLTLAEGQTEITFALIQTGDISADINTTLSATFNGSVSGTPVSVTSNTWAINVKDAGEPSHTFIGDQRAKLIGTETQLTVPANGAYAWGETSWTVDGTLTGGKPEVDFNDVITGTDEADKISGKGGNDALSGGEGNDQIDGGDGDDLIGGGAGSDTIKGGAGTDIIFEANDLTVLQRSKADDTWDLPVGNTLISKGSTWGFSRSPDVNICLHLSPVCEVASERYACYRGPRLHRGRHTQSTHTPRRTTHGARQELTFNTTKTL